MDHLGGNFSSKLNRRTTVSGSIGKNSKSFDSTLSISESFEAVRQMSPLVKSKADSMAAAAAANKTNSSENNVTNIYGLEQKSDGTESSSKKFSPKRTAPSFSRRMTAPSGIFSPGSEYNGGEKIQETL